MAVTCASLASGQLANSKATLYAVPALTRAHISWLSLVNENASARTVNLYVKRSGSSSRRIIAKDLSLAAGGTTGNIITGPGLKLSAGDEIEGDASVATSVDYVIAGGLES